MAQKKKSSNTLLQNLTAVTPLDGRYRKRLDQLSQYVSEHALIKTRFEIEIKYLLELSKFKIIRRISATEKKRLLSFIEKFDIGDSASVKILEEETRHDVKALERTLRKLLQKTSLRDITEMIHFGLTSEDINNLAYRLQLTRATHAFIIPLLKSIINDLADKANKYMTIPMLARTHGQAAVSTTLGKELVVYAQRLQVQLRKLEKQKLTGKLNGAVGNFNALHFTFAKVNWIKFSETFAISLGLVPNLFTTQINPYDDVAEYFQIYQRVNSILIDLDQDLWRYVSDGWFIQQVKRGEVGSSTMPQKVNPIDFENSEGNLGMANSILEFMSRKLMISRLQRDLSDSTVIRNIGTALGYSVIGYSSILTGLSRIIPDVNKIKNALEEDWSTVTEGAQTFLRSEKVKDPYSLFASLSRGKHLNEEEWKKLIAALPVTVGQKKKLLELSPQKYIGLSIALTKKALRELKIGK